MHHRLGPIKDLGGSVARPSTNAIPPYILEGNMQRQRRPRPTRPRCVDQAAASPTAGRDPNDPLRVPPLHVLPTTQYHYQVELRTTTGPIALGPVGRDIPPRAALEGIASRMAFNEAAVGEQLALIDPVTSSAVAEMRLPPALRLIDAAPQRPSTGEAGKRCRGFRDGD